jgi:hypothetical protein
MKFIPLTQGKFAQVDDEDYEWLTQYNWKAQKQKLKSGETWYAANKNLGYMHRVIAEKHGFLAPQIDHHNSDGLDNCKLNLRPCNSCHNNRNRRKTFGKTSQYKGVCWIGWRAKWGVGIYVNKKGKFLGYFDDEVEAARSYDRAAIEYFGEFAKTNFPLTDYATAC